MRMETFFIYLALSCCIVSIYISLTRKENVDVIGNKMVDYWSKQTLKAQESQSIVQKLLQDANDYEEKAIKLRKDAASLQKEADGLLKGAITIPTVEQLRDIVGANMPEKSITEWRNMQILRCRNEIAEEVDERGKDG